jgi:competence protein ComEC
MSSIEVLLFVLLSALSLLDPRPVNINTAGENALFELPGLSRSQAQSIIEWRERFGSFFLLDDLLLVPGIGSATLDALDGMLTLGSPELPVDTLHWLPVSSPGDTLLSIAYLDVGNGDATLLQTLDGETWLIDGGPPSEGPLVSPAAARLLEMDVEHLDVIAFTHPHADHIGGLPDVIGTVGTGILLDPGIRFSSFLYEELLREALGCGADYVIVERGDVWNLSDDVSIEIVYTGADQPVNLDLNEASAVFLIRCADFTALLAGDICEDTEMLLTDSLPPVTVLLAPHHGSGTSAFPPFIRDLRPQIAVISCGRNNPFGHPHGDVLDMYGSLGSEILRTDRLGTIVLHTDGISIQHSSSMRGAFP